MDVVMAPMMSPVTSCELSGTGAATPCLGGRLMVSAVVVVRAPLKCATEGVFSECGKRPHACQERVFVNRHTITGYQTVKIY